MPVYNPDTIKMIGNKCLRVWPLHWSQEIIYTLPCKAFSKALAKILCSAGIRAILGARVVLVFLVLGSSSQMIIRFQNQKNQKNPKSPAGNIAKPSRKQKKTNKDLQIYGQWVVSGASGSSIWP